MKLPTVHAWTDGSCYPNPGPGGWGFILIHPSTRAKAEHYGGERYTTNNRMEQMAAVKALEALNKPCEVRLHTDSRYLANGFCRGWVNGWRRNGWRSSQGKPVANRDIWERLYLLNKEHRVAWLWVKGHAGNEHNERADRLAYLGRKAIDQKESE